jgi:thymidylate synthase ThyX
MVESVETNPFIPIAWQKEHTGMQGSGYWTEENIIKYLEDSWIESMHKALQSAKLLTSKGVTKQLCNRLLEPFMWHTVICTATDYENFFKLRDHEAAEIHIQELARRMKEAINESTPKVLHTGEWHIPFGEEDIKIATAKCARVSYTTVGSTSNNSHTADIELYNRLLESGHMSPFEHCAQVMEDTRHCWKPYSRNFKGFVQYREIVESTLQ